METQERWDELKRHLIEEVKWYREQQRNPHADIFYFFLREGFVRDTIAYMQYLEGKDTPETRTLLALLGDPEKVNQTGWGGNTPKE